MTTLSIAVRRHTTNQPTQTHALLPTSQLAFSTARWGTTRQLRTGHHPKCQQADPLHLFCYTRNACPQTEQTPSELRYKKVPAHPTVSLIRSCCHRTALIAAPKESADCCNVLAVRAVLAHVAPLARSRRVSMCGCIGIFVALHQVDGAMGHTLVKTCPAPARSPPKLHRAYHTKDQYRSVTRAKQSLHPQAAILVTEKRLRPNSHPSMNMILHLTRLLPAVLQLRRVLCGYPYPRTKRGNTLTTCTCCSVCGQPPTCHPKTSHPTLRPPGRAHTPGLTMPCTQAHSASSR